MATVTQALDRICTSFRVRLKGLQMRTGIARMVLLGLVLLPLVMLVDWWVHLAAGWRLLALVSWAAGLGAVCWFTLLKPMARSWSNHEVLTYLDRAAPKGQGMLLDLYELVEAKDDIQELDSDTGKGLADAAVDDLTPLAKQVKMGEMLQRRSARRWTLAAIAPAVILCLVALVPGGAHHLGIGLVRFFNPFSNMRWPHLTTIEVAEPETGWKIPQLEPFPITATVTGEIPPQVTLAYRSESTGYWIKEKIQVREDEESGAVTYTFPEVREPLEFYIEGGDYVTDHYEIDIVARPFLKKVTAAYNYPPYAKIPDRTIDSGQLVGLEGTTVNLTFESSMALSKAIFAMEGEEKEELTRSDDGLIFTKKLVLTRSASYAIELYEPSGFREARPEVYEIRVTEDHKPEVEILAPGRNMKLTRNASMEVAFRVRDDFGIKKVKFMHALEEAEHTPLTDRVTGPIKEEGRNPPPVRFSWDLRKMEKLPKEGTLTYYVQVEDVNPTGRGKAKSPKFQIKLVKPSKFHQEAIYQARRVLTEARNAWRNQFEAWEKAGEFQKKGTGKEDDEIWTALADAQDKSIRAAKEVDNLLKDLSDKYERNHMAKEFMAGRLGVISQLLLSLLEKHHDPLEKGMRKTVPRTAAEAQPGRLLGTRRSVLFQEKTASKLVRYQHQKLALLTLERILHNLYDWQDLQDALIRTTRVYEDQEDLLVQTDKIGKKYFMIDIYDLSDEAQDEVLTVGKKQNTVFEAESQLEDHLSFLIKKGEYQNRKSILKPLREAFKALRDARVNDYLKAAAEQIQKNQAAVILDKQKDAVRTLAAVKVGLEIAGAHTEVEPPITLAMNPSPRQRWGEPPKEKKKDKKDDKVAKADGMAQPPSIWDVVNRLPPGEDGISLAVREAVQMLARLNDRTRYLNNNRSNKEMPRFIKMKLGRLGEYQGDTNTVLNAAIDRAKDAHVPIKDVLGTSKVHLDQSTKLVRGGETSNGTQQLMTDTRMLLDDLLQYIAHRKKVKEFVANNKKGGGLDAHKRKYLFRDQNLDNVAAIHDDLNYGHLLVRDVVRTLERFEKHAAKAGARAEVEKVNRTGAGGQTKKSDELLKAVGKKTEAFAKIEFDEKEMEVDPIEAVKTTGVGDLLQSKLEPIATGITAGGQDAKQKEALVEIVKAWYASFTALEDLIEERVRPKPKKPVLTADGKPAEEQKVTQEQRAKDRSREAIVAMLSKDERLPAEIRDLMVRFLKDKDRKFPPDYKELLTSYYLSFVDQESKQ